MTLTIAPICRRCKKAPCRWYGDKGGYSVQCKACNMERADQRREASRKRKERQKLEKMDISLTQH